MLLTGWKDNFHYMLSVILLSKMHLGICCNKFQVRVYFWTPSGWWYYCSTLAVKLRVDKMAQLKSVRTYIQDTRNRVFEIHCSQHALQSSRLIKWLNKPVKNQFCLLLGIIIAVGDRCGKKKKDREENRNFSKLAFKNMWCFVFKNQLHDSAESSSAMQFDIVKLYVNNNHRRITKHATLLYCEPDREICKRRNYYCFNERHQKACWREAARLTTGDRQGRISNVIWRGDGIWCYLDSCGLVAFHRTALINI